MSGAPSEEFPSPPENPPDGRQSPDKALRVLAFLAGLSIGLYGAISWISWQFDYGSVPADRPILVVLLLFAAAFLACLLAIRVASRTDQSRRLLGLIVGAAVVFRVVVLFSVPIQEVDIYRYLWDGSAACAGVNPFRYSPEQVRAADSHVPYEPDLLRLVALRDNFPALAEILQRVHFGELPTIYPPTSQDVFAAATATTPSNSSVLVRVFIMKLWFLGFDLGTLGMVIALLRLAHKPVGLSVIYAWCPLLLKEVANSGHLDTIVVFLATLAVYLAARLITKQAGKRNAWSTAAQAALVGLVLALAVGAKLYPMVLAPLVLLVLARRIGWRHVPIPAASFVATTLLLLSPLMPRATATPFDAPGLPPAPAVATDPSQGLPPFCVAGR